MQKPIKQKRCKSCGDEFKSFSSTAKVCSMSCALDLAGKETQKKKAEKEYNRITREMKTTANENSLSFWAKKTEKICNEYILIRDKNEGCISCGTRKPDIKYDAGHYISVGSSKFLRYEETNIHKQCSNNCNVHKSSNTIAYRKALVKKYGAEHVEWLEFDHPTPRRRIDDYKQIFEYYKAKAKELKANV